MGKSMGIYKGKLMKATKLLPCLLAFAAIPAMAAAANATPKRIGPVSYYGALHTSGGKIIGSKNNEEAVIRGMSLFWSDATGIPYYNKNVISWAAENLPMDVFRFAMGINYYDSNGGTSNALDKSYSYAGAPEGYMTTIDQMVEAAIENDIYIILDWHSHRADSEQSIAKDFFKKMAEKYKDVPNVIYEIFNEPVNQGWSQIQSYANAVIPGIRASTENLVLVGTPSWSQMTQYGGVSGTNVGYVLHFYAGTHGVGTYGGRATQAKSSGNAVFITEWGTTNADGAGSPSSGSTQEWMSFMDQNNISNCNWSLRAVGSQYATDGKKETSAIFDGGSDGDLNTIGKLNSASYSASGKLVQPYLAKHKRDWASMLAKTLKSGSCSFNATTVKESESSVASAFKSGCTYSSSNEGVVTSTGDVKSAGYVIMTANDGSQSVVQVTAIPKQTIPNFQDLSCNYSGTCNVNRAISYSKKDDKTLKEWILTTETKTLEGSTFTLTSLNPEIVTVKKASCVSSSCSNTQSGKQVTMFEFKGFGTAKIVGTAPAATGFGALNDTITVTFTKATNKMTNNFKNTTLAFGASAPKLVPDTTMYHTKVTYTFNGKDSSPYVTKSGNGLTAGNQNAIVRITANAPEADNYQEFHQSITVIVGDSSQAVNKDEYYSSEPVVVPPDTGVGILKTNKVLPLHATIAKSMLSVGSRDAGDINVDVFSVTGQKVLSKTMRNNATMSLANVPTGSYLIVITQDIKQLNVKWNKAE